MKRLIALTGIASSLALAGCNQPTGTPSETLIEGITVQDAWCRPTPNGAKVAGCYVTLISGSDDVMKSVSSDLADMAQVHEMKHEDGMMKMSHLANGLALPAGLRTELKPHGNHIMLMGLKGPLVDGQTTKITLTFDKAEAQTIDFAIRRPPVVSGEE